MNRYLVGFVCIIAGFLIVVYRDRIKSFTGSIGFAEKYLGVGGTWTFYILLGIGLFIFGLMWMTGALQAWLESNLGTIF